MELHGPHSQRGHKGQMYMATVSMDTANERDRFARLTALSWETGTGAGVVTYD